MIFTYNIPRDLLLTKSLTRKGGEGSIFTNKELSKFRPVFAKLIGNSSFYLDVMKIRKASFDNPIAHVLKMFVADGKKFSKKFLNQDLRYESQKYKSLILEPNDYHYNDSMKNILSAIRVILDIFKKTFLKIKLNNRKLYYKFINFCFDSSSNNESPIKKTDILSQIISASKMNPIFWITNRELLSYKASFQRYHRDFRNYQLDVQHRNPTFIAGLSLIVRSDISNMKPETFLTMTHLRRSHNAYMTFLYEFGLIKRSLGINLSIVPLTSTEEIFNGDIIID